MDKSLVDKERKIERLRLDNEEMDERMKLSEKKAIEKEMKKRYGRDWKKILGVFKGLKPDREAMQTLFSINPELKELNKPLRLRKL